MIEAEHAEPLHLQGVTQRLQQVWLVVDDHDRVGHDAVRLTPPLSSQPDRTGLVNPLDKTAGLVRVMVDEPLGDGTSMGRIAIVDDDRTFTDLLVEILGELGYQATGYYQSEGTFALLRHLQPDLILVDVRIEGPQSGWTLLDLLRADEATRAIPLPNLAT
jgi:hypothetical protein